MLIELSNISKKYGDISILEDVNFAIENGKSIAIVGASGSGKTTFLQIASLLDDPDSGTVKYCGSDVSGKALEFRRKYTGFVYQFHNLMPEFTAAENLEIAARIKECELGSVTELFAELGLSGKEKRRPAELSGGECQRVSIARAIFSKPSIIFADEPTGNLDPENALRTMHVMLDVVKRRGISMVIVTHNYEIAKMCDETYEIHNMALVKKIWAES